jgi:hypothetical protein
MEQKSGTGIRKEKDPRGYVVPAGNTVLRAYGTHRGHAILVWGYVVGGNL